MLHVLDRRLKSTKQLALLEQERLTELIRLCPGAKDCGLLDTLELLIAAGETKDRRH